MGKKKFQVGSKKQAKHETKVLTADDYLSNGVDAEEAGEKWRAGDAAKSMRFFVRAIVAYDEGLAKFPSSFDLAYNKARLQYDITQHPTLLEQREESLEDLLRIALDSSRVAMSLRQDNEDALFNTAQVLTSLAECMTEVIHLVEDVRQEALRLLEESMELFQRTLTLQEFKMSEMEARQDSAMTDADAMDTANDVITGDQIAASSKSPSPNPISSTRAETSEEWAEVIEPITTDTLLDTALSQLGTLTTLCSIITTDEGRGLAWIEEYSSTLLTHKIPVYATNSPRGAEIAFQKAKFLSALADAAFRNRRIDVRTYARAAVDAYADIDALGDPASDPEIVVTKAEANITFNAAVRKSRADGGGDGDGEGRLTLRWKALTTAMELLTGAASGMGVERGEASRIHLLRGDVELLRLGLAGDGLETAKRSAAVLAKNAGTYYQGAAQMATDVRVKEEAVIKKAIARRLVSDNGEGEREKLGAVLSRDHPRAYGVIEEAAADGLVTVEWLREEQVVIGDF